MVDSKTLILGVAVLGGIGAVAYFLSQGKPSGNITASMDQVASDSTKWYP